MLIEGLFLWLLGGATVMLGIVIFRQTGIVISSLRRIANDADLPMKMMFLAHGIVSFAGPLAIMNDLGGLYAIAVFVQAVVSFWTYMIMPMIREKSSVS